MHKDEQEPGTDPIDHTDTSSSTEAPPTSSVAPTVQVHVQTERIPLVSATNWSSALIASAVIAVVMLIAFLIGVQTIFPGPPSVTASVEAPAVTDTVAPQAVTDDPPKATADEKPTEAKDPTPATKPADPADSSKESVPAAPPAKDATAAPPTKTSTRGLGDHSISGARPLLLSRLARSAAVADEVPSEAEASDDRAGFFGRIVLYIKFFILVCLSAILASVVLGGLALVVDRPLGDFKAAVSRVILCCWISTLALFVPSPEPWLRDLIHYAAAAVLFWLMGMLILKLSPRLSGALLGGTVALLAATAIGSRIVVWATW